MKNSKLTRGVVAGLGGLALLLGGGTFALWYQSDSISAGTIDSGALSFSAGTSTWTDQTGTPTDIADISAFRIAPGDTVRLTVPLTVTAKGDNLKATLKLDTSGLTCATPNLDLCDALKANTSMSVSGLTSTTVDGTTGGYELTDADDGKVATVAVTVHLPAYQNGDSGPQPRTNWWGQIAQNQEIDLSTITFDLAQHL